MVNIIIPIYKAKETLSKALDSLVSQTTNMFTVTLCQDADDEDYNEIIKEYERRGLTIYLLVSKENKGPGAMRQMGIDHSKMFDYLMFLDSDDMLYPKAVETLYKEAKKNDADVVFSTFHCEDKDKTIYSLESRTIPVTWMHGKIYKTKYLYDNNIRFLDNIRNNEDSYFNLVALNCTNSKVRLDIPTYLWRNNNNSLTRSKENGNFLKRSWCDYVISQLEGIIKILSIMETMSSKTLAATCINIYWIIEKIKYFYPEEYDLKKNVYEPYIEKLRSNDKFFELLDDEDFWRTIIDTLKGCVEEDDNVIFPKIPFSIWLNETFKENQ